MCVCDARQAVARVCVAHAAQHHRVRHGTRPRQHWLMAWMDVRL